MTELAETESSSSGNTESEAHVESIKPTQEEFVEPVHDEQRDSVVFDFSGCKGSYLLPYEFRAKDDKHQDQSDKTEQNSVNDDHQELEREIGQCSVNDERAGDATRDPEEEVEALERYPETEQSTVPFVPL